MTPPRAGGAKSGAARAFSVRPSRPLERSSGAARLARPGGFANKPADLCERSA